MVVAGGRATSGFDRGGVGDAWCIYARTIGAAVGRRTGSDADNAQCDSGCVGANASNSAHAAGVNPSRAAHAAGCYADYAGRDRHEHGV